MDITEQKMLRNLSLSILMEKLMWVISLYVWLTNHWFGWNSKRSFRISIPDTQLYWRHWCNRRALAYVCGRPWWWRWRGLGTLRRSARKVGQWALLDPAAVLVRKEKQTRVGTKPNSWTTTTLTRGRVGRTTRTSANFWLWRPILILEIVLVFFWWFFYYL